MPNATLDFDAEFDAFNGYLASARKHARALNVQADVSQVKTETPSDSEPISSHKRPHEAVEKPSLPKIAKRSKISSPNAPSDSRPFASSSVKAEPSASSSVKVEPSASSSVKAEPSASSVIITEDFTAPDWYKKLTKSKVRARGASSNVDTSLLSLKTAITDAGTRSDEKNLQRLIQGIHRAVFLEVTPQLLRDHRLLNDDGLPSVFNSSQAQSSRYPFYTKLDAEELWRKWASRIFTNDLMHGITFSKDESYGIKDNYPLKRRCDVFGSNNLVNGQWWPIQLCLNRDGCHMTPQAGISGRAGEGAWSVVMSGGNAEDGSKYPDHDAGDVVDYCGTDSKDDQITDSTLRMLETHERKKPIRLIRSHKCRHSDFRPAKGLRYDGLYEITAHEILDKDKHRYRFKLVRMPGQDPIRHDGQGVRPTSEELREWTKLSAEKKFIVN